MRSSRGWEPGREIRTKPVFFLPGRFTGRAATINNPSLCSVSHRSSAPHSFCSRERGLHISPLTQMMGMLHSRSLPKCGSVCHSPGREAWTQAGISLASSCLVGQKQTAGLGAEAQHTLDTAMLIPRHFPTDSHQPAPSWAGCVLLG